MALEIRLLGQGDGDLLSKVADGVFDNSINDLWLTECLDDPRHHLAVAIDGGLMVGMASAVHDVHPDKPPQLWVNEVGVTPTHRGHWVGKQLMRALLNFGRQLGCLEAWVLTDEENSSARHLYESVGGVKGPAPIMYSFRLSLDDVDSAPGTGLR